MRLAVIFALVLAAGPAKTDVTLPDVLSNDGLDGFVTIERLPIPSQPFLMQGRAVWEGTCMGCHGGNKATGAPKITATETWQPRIAQGLPVLIDHAINGFLGKTYAQMPARGGNPGLSDADVTRAVTFMVWASGGAAEAEAFINQNKD